MSLEVFFTYFMAVALLTASPGPMILLSMKHGTESGVSGVLISAITGMVCVCLMIVLCFFGMSQILQNSALLKNLFLVFGVFYIFYLGISYMISSSYGLGDGVTKQDEAAFKSRKKIIREMSLVAFTNPKDWIFFGLFLPQFINFSSALFPQLLVILVTFALCDLFFLSFYGIFSFYFFSFFKKYISIYKKVLGFALIIVAVMMAYHGYFLQ